MREAIICPICLNVVRTFSKTNNGINFKCEKCETEVFVKNENKNS
jgi:hypothetical protein